MVQPEKRIKVGNVIVSVFSNEIDGQRFLRSVSIQKFYRDKEGSFRPTNSLNTNDIPKAILALARAYDYVLNADTPDDLGANSALKS